MDFRSHCSCEGIVENYVSGMSSVDSTNFRINKSIQIGEYLVAFINYPNCSNYEGNKILVFEGIDISKLNNLSKVDPHFCDDKGHPSPIARFEPTDEGWKMALKFSKMMRDEI